MWSVFTVTDRDFGRAGGGEAGGRKEVADELAGVLDQAAGKGMTDESSTMRATYRHLWMLASSFMLDPCRDGCTA